MILKDGQGRVYKAHIWHFTEYLVGPAGVRDPALRVWTENEPEQHQGMYGTRRSTGCVLHRGYCASKERPCVSGADGEPVHFGVAHCHTSLDEFRRREGHRLAFFRALNKMLPGPVNKELRGQLWESYFTKVKKPRKRG